jgi:hypothetical protein
MKLPATRTASRPFPVAHCRPLCGELNILAAIHEAA